MKFVIILLLSTFMPMSFAAGEFIPEASGVCRMGDSLIIAGDEEPQAFWMMKEVGEKPRKVKVTGAKWDDLEGLATVNADTFFAITSHSRTKKGKRKPEREQLMLVTYINKMQVQRSWNLRDKILAQLKSSHSNVLDMGNVESASPDDGGLNIEGLAYHQGQLYLGLRSPLTSKGDALILVIKNAEEMLQGEAPVLGNVMNVRLSGRGIRSLDSDGSGLLILSGSTDDSDKAFGLDHLLFGSRTLRKFPLEGFENLLRPEGVVVENDNSFTFVQDFLEPQDQEIVISLRQ